MTSATRTTPSCFALSHLDLLAFPLLPLSLALSHPATQRSARNSSPFSCMYFIRSAVTRLSLLTTGDLHTRVTTQTLNTLNLPTCGHQTHGNQRSMSTLTRPARTLRSTRHDGVVEQLPWVLAPCCRVDPCSNTRWRILQNIKS